MALAQTHPKYGTFYIEEAFRHSAYMNDVATMHAYLERYPELNVNATDEYDQSPCYLAAKRNATEALDLLLEQPKVEVNIPTILGNTALLISAWNDNTPQAKTLLANGANIHHKTKADRNHHGNVSALDIAKERDNGTLTMILESALLRTQGSQLFTAKGKTEPESTEKPVNPTQKRP